MKNSTGVGDYARVQQSDTQLGRAPLPAPTTDLDYDRVDASTGEQSWHPNSERGAETPVAPEP